MAALERSVSKGFRARVEVFFENESASCASWPAALPCDSRSVGILETCGALGPLSPAARVFSLRSMRRGFSRALRRARRILAYGARRDRYARAAFGALGSPCLRRWYARFARRTLACGAGSLASLGVSLPAALVFSLRSNLLACVAGMLAPFGRSGSPRSTHLPVSPLVAPTTVNLSLSPLPLPAFLLAKQYSNTFPKNCNATSLKANVGPCQSSKTHSLSPTFLNGVVSAWRNVA